MLHCSTCDSVSKFLTNLALSSLTGKGNVNECTTSNKIIAYTSNSTNLLVLLLSFYLIFLKDLFLTFQFDIQRTVDRDIFL